MGASEHYLPFIVDVAVLIVIDPGFVGYTENNPAICLYPHPSQTYAGGLRGLDGAREVFLAERARPPSHQTR